MIRESTPSSVPGLHHATSRFDTRRNTNSLDTLIDSSLLSSVDIDLRLP